MPAGTKRTTINSMGTDMALPQATALIIYYLESLIGLVVRVRGSSSWDFVKKDASFPAFSHRV